MLFMGNEFGKVREWAHDGSLDWHLLQTPLHEGLRHWVENINHLYRNEPALHLLECDPAGFEWIDCNDAAASVVSLLRKSKDPNEPVLVVCNFTPIPRMDYLVGVPHGGILHADT